MPGHVVAGTRIAAPPSQIGRAQNGVAPFTVGAGEQLFRVVLPPDLELVEACGTDLSTHLLYHVRR